MEINWDRVEEERANKNYGEGKREKKEKDGIREVWGHQREEKTDWFYGPSMNQLFEILISYIVIF